MEVIEAVMWDVCCRLTSLDIPSSDVDGAAKRRQNVGLQCLGTLGRQMPRQPLEVKQEEKLKWHEGETSWGRGLLGEEPPEGAASWGRSFVGVEPHEGAASWGRSLISERPPGEGA